MVVRCTFVVSAVIAVTAVPVYADRIALESYIGSRPSEADRVMSTMRPLLERERFTVDAHALQRDFSAHLFRSGGVKTIGPKMSADVDSGIGQFLNASWADAVKTLRAAVELARANPIAWVNEPKYRSQVQRGLLYLALSSSKLNDEEIAAKRHHSGTIDLASERDLAMQELIRLFPSFVVSRKQYGLEAEQLFQRIRSEQTSLGRGSLELDIDDPNAIAYVDDTVRPTHTTIGDLIPGEHHVLVVSNYASHEYSVEVIPRQIARLNIDTDLDAVLAVGNDWVGFMYPSQTERTTHEAQYVADLVGKNTSATMAAVLTVGHDNGHLAVTGILYRTSSAKQVRTCQVVLSNASDATSLTKLITCLTAGNDAFQSNASPIKPEVSAGTTTTTTPPKSDAFATSDPGNTGATAPAPSPIEHLEAGASEGKPSYALPVTMVGLGAIAVGIGVYMNVTVEPPAMPPQPHYLYSGTGLAIGVAGLAVGAIGGYLWYRAAHSPRSVPTLQADRHGGSVGMLVRF
ncbi:MAG: hypothetical protein ABJE66_29400 [Deltaproteobacteria bacterium]